MTFVLCICGIAIGAWAVKVSQVTPPAVPLSRQPSVNPFGRGITALGVVEPQGKVVSITAPEPGLVMSVFVDVGDQIGEGQPIMKLDTRRLEADLERARSAVPVAQAEIDRWHALPRAENLPPLTAQVAAARALLDQRMVEFRSNEEAFGRGASTEREVAVRKAAVDEAAAQVARAEAELASVQAGGWAPDLAAAQAALSSRQAEVRSLELLIERLTVRSPRNGVVLRREIQPGEYATTESAREVLLLGDLTRLNVRAQIDEEDLALLGNDPTTLMAVGRTRGAIVSDLTLKLIRIEPFARPKVALSGENTERTDTRVIDVLLEITSPPETMLVPGQAVDVYIDAQAQ
jgi:multidrug efflux pump subunit AcrA (membrane-fusion protein)